MILAMTAHGANQHILLAELSWQLKDLKPEAESVQYPTPTHLNSSGDGEDKAETPLSWKRRDP